MLKDEYLLSIANLRLTIGVTEILHGIELRVPHGTAYALVGESGSGKSMTCFSLLGLTPRNSVIEGEIIYNGEDLTNNHSRLKSLRGYEIGYIPQNPLTSLNPVRTIGTQLRETISINRNISNQKDCEQIAYELLETVQLSNFKHIMTMYPFELSGGMCQRIMIAMALAGKPKLILADEPTTALDVTIQAEIMALLINMTRKFNLSLLLITHDLPLVAQSCELISIIDKGYIVEHGAVAEVFSNPQHSYTRRLMDSVSEI